MSLATVARKEFADARRSRTLLAVVGFFALAVGGITYLLVEFVVSGRTPASPEAVTNSVVVFLSGLGISGFGPVGALVPVIGLLLGFRAVVGERETGQIKLLLGLPHTRQDVVLGKLLGRAAVAVLAVVVGFLVALLVLAVVGPGVTLAPPLVMLAVTLLLAAAYVSLGVGISAVSPTMGWATVLVVGVVGLFQVLWGPLFFAIQIAIFEGPTEALPAWVRGIRAAAPPDAYRSALVAVLQSVSDAGFERIAAPPDAPVYLQDWFGFVWLTFWTVVPVALGYLQFREADLT